MKENTLLNALLCRHACRLLTAAGWPAHVDAEQSDAARFPGWMVVYVRLDAAALVTLLNALSAAEPEHGDALRVAAGKLAGSEAEMVLSGSRYAVAPTLPGDSTQITFPYAGAWLTAEDVDAVLSAVRRALRRVCEQVIADAQRIQAAITGTGATLLARQIRHFRLVVRESDQPGWLDGGDDDGDTGELDSVLSAILERGARFGSVDVFITCDTLDSVLAWGLMCDVLRIPGEPVRRWLDLHLLREVVAEARSEVNSVRRVLAPVRAAETA